MKLAELEQFLKDCLKAEIPFPRETMAVVIDDFHEVVPEEKHNLANLEFNVTVEQFFARVIILPKPDSVAMRKAISYDKLESKIAKCYVDDNGDELSEEESEDIDLGTIGEIAASHFGYL